MIYQKAVGFDLGCSLVCFAWYRALWIMLKKW